MSNTQRVEPTTAVLAMYGFRGRKLSSIEMNSIYTAIDFRNEKLIDRVLSDDAMVYLKDVCVEKFSMVNVNMLWLGSAIVDDTVFSKCIKYMNLSLNDLYGDVSYLFDLSLMSNLVDLNLSSHRERSHIHHSPLQTHNNLQHVTEGFSIPETLEYLNMDGLLINYRITLAKSFHIYGAKSLRYFSSARSGLINIETEITGLENLTIFDISGNDFALMNEAFFDNFPNLQSLIMTDVNFRSNYLSEYGERLFHPLQNLKKVNLYNNDIKFLDKEMLSSSPVEEIILSHNRFESIPLDLTTLPKLHFLDLSFNSLAVLSDTEMKLLDDLALRNNLTLIMEGNLLSCGCGNLDFIRWLYNTKVQVIHKSIDICQMSDGTVTKIHYIKNHYKKIWMACNGKIILCVTSVLYTVVLLVMFVLYLTTRRRTLLVNTFLRMFGYGPLPPTRGRSDFTNDAYIGYSDNDYQYICHTVRDFLETEHDLTLFIRDRDTIPGDQIADDIISGIDSSWRSVLILTEAFLNDRWCRFIINRVVYTSARRPRGSVILVLSVDVRRGDIDPALLNVVEERDIFYVERYREDEDRLWRDVCYGIKV